MEAEVAVIGGGIVGLSCALHLQLRGRRVALVDPGEARAQASFGNAGVIGRGSLFPVAAPGLRRKLWRYALNADPAFRYRAAALPSALPWLVHLLRRADEPSWRAAAAALDPLTAAAYGAHRELAAIAGAGHLISRPGYLKLYRSEAAFAASALERELLSRHRVATEILDADDIARLEPALTRRFARGLLAPESGAVSDPGALLAAYRAAFLGRGGRMIAARCEGIEAGEGVVLSWPGGSLRARTAVIAAGAGAKALARRLGYRFPLAAERGYHREYRAAQELGRPVHDVEGAYVLAPMDGRIRLVTGIELARPGDPPDPRQLARVLPEAAATLPLGEPASPEPWCGSRPSTPDGLPVIGRAPRHAGIVFAFGHGHIGLSTGPITGRIVADLVDGIAPPLPLAPFAAERFGA